jgi:hypothetical protein
MSGNTSTRTPRRRTRRVDLFLTPLDDAASIGRKINALINIANGRGAVSRAVVDELRARLEDIRAGRTIERTYLPADATILLSPPARISRDRTAGKG